MKADEKPLIYDLMVTAIAPTGRARQWAENLCSRYSQSVIASK